MKIKFHINLYLLCISDDISSLIDADLTSKIKDTKTLKQNEEIEFDDLVIGQIYMIEIIPNITSKLCPKHGAPCPNIKYDYSSLLNNISCGECNNMVLILPVKEFYEVRLGKETCLENINTSDILKIDSYHLLYKNVHLVTSENFSKKKLPTRMLANSLNEHSKNHYCSVEYASKNFKEPLTNKEIFFILTLNFILIMLLSFILILIYSYALYGETFFFFTCVPS